MSIYDTDEEHVVGSVNDAAQELYDELLTTGYSLIFEDVVKVFKNTIKEYVGWSGRLLTQTPQGLADVKKPLLVINENTVLSVTDWLIIKPVVMAHCDLVQAKRMEGAQGLGVNPAGMSSSEARTLYSDAVLKMQKESFQCEPFTVDTPQNDRGLDLFFTSNMLE